MSEAYKIKDTWCRLIPLLHRILAGSAASDEFPEPSRANRLEDACAVWETLHYLLRQLIGWEDPGQGLAWWYGAGKPVGDSPLLEVVSRIWDKNGELDYYAAWTWGVPKYAVERLEDDTFEHVVKTSLPDFRRPPEPSWWNPYYGGENALHLGHSDWFDEHEPQQDRAEWYFDQKTRRAVLVTNNIGSWRRDLARADAKLPDLGNRSWYVQIFDRQHGSLGTFRKSRETGKWFQGKHSVHVRGNSVVGG